MPTISIGIDLGDLKRAKCVSNGKAEIVEERCITNRCESWRTQATSATGGNDKELLEALGSDLNRNINVDAARKNEPC